MILPRKQGTPRESILVISELAYQQPHTEPDNKRSGFFVSKVTISVVVDLLLNL